MSATSLLANLMRWVEGLRQAKFCVVGDLSEIRRIFCHISFIGICWSTELQKFLPIECHLICLEVCHSIRKSRPDRKMV